MCARAQVEASAELVDRLIVANLARPSPEGWTFAHGMLAESIERISEEASRTQDHARTAATVLFDTYDDLSRQGHYRQAVSNLGRTADLARRGELQHVNAEATLKMGRCLVILGQMRAGLTALKTGLKRSRVLQDALLEALALHGLGNLHSHGGDREAARDAFEEALTLHQTAGRRAREGVVRGDLGLLWMRMGRMAEAQPHLESAIALHREAGDRLHEGITLGNLGILYCEVGDVESALQTFGNAILINQELGNRRAVGIFLGNLGTLNMELARFSVAETLLNDALKVHREVGNRAFEALALGNLGELKRRTGAHSLARSQLEQALALCQELGYHGEASFLGSLAELEATEGHRRASEKHMTRALELVGVSGHTTQLGLLRCRQARIALGYGDRDAARTHLAQAMGLARQEGAAPQTVLGAAIGHLQRELEVVGSKAPQPDGFPEKTARHSLSSSGDHPRQPQLASGLAMASLVRAWTRVQL